LENSLNKYLRKPKTQLKYKNYANRNRQRTK
jgi:hypothetical protein